jgi:hypothetical protein
MSIVVSETSPRALLDSALQLSYTLNLMGDDDSAAKASVASRGPGFILHEVEAVLLQVRKDLDIAYQAGSEAPPLMMRLREHINATSAVLTGNSVRFATVDSTTLHELIDSLSVLNASVSCSKETMMCITM